MNNKIYLLSFDCANKSLAVSFFSYNLNYKSDIQIINNNNNSNINKFININKILNNIIHIFYLNVIDLFPDFKVKELDILQRSNSLKFHINKINSFISNFNFNKIIVCIEYQPSFNDKSRVIFNQLIYEYSNNKLFDIQIIHPTLKNTIYFHKQLKHGNFIAKYNNQYTANKNHTKQNFLYFIKLFHLSDLIKHIKKKNIDDIADSFIQAIAYIQYNLI